MFLLDGVVVTSASDLTAASKCEFAFLRALDAKLGRVPPVEHPADAMLERTSVLGDSHEARVLTLYRGEFGDGVVEIDRPRPLDREGIDLAVSATRAAFEDGADVVFQATFFDDAGEPLGTGADAADVADVATAIAFIGFADFIVRMPDGRYRVQDTKLARTARVTALLQVAAYAEQLERMGIAVDDQVELLLGDGAVSSHRLADIVPVYRSRRRRLLTIVADRLAAPGGEPVAWGDPRYAVCGHCDACEEQIQLSRDVLLVAGMRVTQRAKLADAGIHTIDELAASTGPVGGMAEATVAGLRQQARLQVSADDAGPPPVLVHNPSALAALPQPEDGDIFFDFEGDPLYTEGVARPGTRTQWGLDYLFGLIEADGTYRAFWAHSFVEERRALREFLDYLRQRRERHPAMHVYHYAAYERTHLLSLAARHGVGEDEVDALLRENVLIDLYPLVRKAVRVGSRSYSIKKLEPLYMGADIREGDVTNAADSITEYVAARDLIEVGAHDPEALATGERMLAEIADYNEYDCVSTLRLRDWLIARAAEHGVPIGAARPERGPDELEPSPLRDGLLALAGDARGDHVLGPDLTRERTADETTAAFAAAAIDYHRREDKSYWWEHFARLVQPIDEWAETRDVLVIERVEVVAQWYREGRQRNERRRLRLIGELAPGSNIRVSDQQGPFLLYEHPGPFTTANAEPRARSAHRVSVLAVEDDGILVEEQISDAVGRFDAVPSALAPGPPPPPGQQRPAIEQWARGILDAQPGWPRDSMTDLLRRHAPRTARGPGLAERVLEIGGDAAGRDAVDAVSRALLDLDDSYLAVQGPPGTGKTHLGAHVIARLVTEHRWKIGVVAQSHAVVEHLLAACVRAGLDPALVGKVPARDADPVAVALLPFTVLPTNGQLQFAGEHGGDGFVVGGTAWDLSNRARVPRRSLDLLVVDEAGQFSLASTIAASVAARNLLLLGDPQQLPQVSQGTHPEPVDGSTLGWVSEGHDVLPAELGFFLAETRRMHPALAEPVSRLSYEGKLRAHPDASRRLLDGVSPGLHPVPVQHEGNATESPQEAAEVVRLARDLIGRAWTDPSANRAGEPLRQEDVIVVTPYNAQLALVRNALDAAGLDAVRVGTVDKFQGQQAVVAIVSLAASSAEDVPRGMSFLIMKNRLNVAISRAQWAAYLVHSPALAEGLPVTPDGVAELSAFITLVSE
jgi:RecB family nuclease, putative, TM0106 family